MKRMSGMRMDEPSDAIESKMNLPMILCLVIIKRSGAQMLDMYEKYKASQKSKVVLSLQDFVFTFSISTNKGFVFDNTRLAFDMMASDADADSAQPDDDADAAVLVRVTRFAALAPSMGLATTQYSQELFSCLATKKGVLEFPRFKSYVDILRRVRKEGLEMTAELQTASADLKAELRDDIVLMYRKLAVETSAMLPRLGRLILCKSRIVFEVSLSKTQRFYAYSKLCLEEGEQGMKLCLLHEEDAEGHRIKGARVLTLDLIGVGEHLDREREYTLCYIRDLMTIHALTSKPPYADADSLGAFVSEVSRRIQSMRVLEMMDCTNPLRLSAFHRRRDEDSYARFMQRTANAISDGAQSDREHLWGLISGPDVNSPSRRMSTEVGDYKLLPATGHPLSYSHAPLSTACVSASTHFPTTGVDEKERSHSPSPQRRSSEEATEEVKEFQFSTFSTSVATFQVLPPIPASLGPHCIS
jgi:hypothetical protein